jgi:DprA/Smf-like nucleotide binding protein involved in DNA uptake/DNA recombination-mediator protein A
VPDQTTPMREQDTPMREQDNTNRLRLARAEGVGPVTYRRLLTRFDTAAAALRSLPRLARAGGKANPPVVPTEADVIRELNRAAKLGARLIFLGDADYPPLLARLDDAPPVIAVQGDAALLALRAVALVGGHNASVNGRRIAGDLGAELARAGLVVVSGMARGSTPRRTRARCPLAIPLAAPSPWWPAASMSPTRLSTPTSSAASPPWSPRRRLAPRPRQATSRAAIASLPG